MLHGFNFSHSPSKNESIHFARVQRLGSCVFVLYHLQYKPKKTKFKKGELISKTGYTGYCIPAGIKGSHLHVDRKVNGKHIDVLQEIKYASSVSTHKPKNITIKKGTIVNMFDENVIQPSLVTISALKLAAEVTRMILKIDDIVLSR